MSTRPVHMEFAPPPTPGILRALLLALAAHALLVLGLSLGVQWKRDITPVTVEAELWSSIPEQAAPPAPVPLEPSEPAPLPVPKPAPVSVVSPPNTPALPDPAIAIAKEKVRLQKERELEKQLLQERQEKERQRQALAEQEKKKVKAAKQKKLQDEIEAREKLARDKAAAQKPATPTAPTAQQLKDAADNKKLAELRRQNLQRMTGLAAGTGDEASTGTAAQSSGPSAGYAGRIRARIKPNITYTETISGNPAAEVEVRTAPEGTIISRKLIQSSGVNSWDVAVLAAIDKTEVLPRDTNGRVPSTLILVFRPRD
jgi:colicin import membrane protein